MRNKVTFRSNGELSMLDAKKLRRDLDDVVQQHTYRIAMQASDNAPVDTGALKASIPSSVHRDEAMRWIFGSYLPYAQRQEYEHKTKRAYFRRAMWAGEQPFYRAVRRAVERRLRL